MGWIFSPSLRREIVWRLKHGAEIRARMERLLEEARSDAISLTGPLGHEGTPGKGTPGDPTGRAAEKVLRAREKLETEERWARVFERVNMMPETAPGTDAHKVISMLYGGGWTVEETARAMHYERQTIMRRRDEYLTMAAFVAAEEGLTRKEGGDVSQ